MILNYYQVRYCNGAVKGLKTFGLLTHFPTHMEQVPVFQINFFEFNKLTFRGLPQPTK